MGRILELPRHGYRQHPVDALGVIVDGDDYYREFYRAALTAEHTMVMTGWQFDSGVPLLRGEDAAAARAPITLLKFLNHLCEVKPDLKIWILAWDFHMVFAAEREWMQKLVFHWTTHERLKFRFDSTHVDRGSHHQKFVVIDGGVSFLGGLDLAEDRWDDRKHLMENPLRVSRGKPHKPFHDIQVYLRGRALGRSLNELFAKRWELAGGDPIDAVLKATGDAPLSYQPHNLVPLPATAVTLSRTDPHAVPEGKKPCAEILALHESAIASAERLIYAETQYLSSHQITGAFERRMRDPHLPKLELVFILNMRGETLKEQAAVGLAQAQNLGRLREVAERTGHHLGLYYTLPECGASKQPERATYIHSKLMIVDDRFLTVGSANLTNRSMSVDSELNITVEANGDGAGDAALALAIHKLRMVLIAEHTGGPELELTAGLVARLDLFADGVGPGCRLRHHPSPTEGEKVAIALLDPQKLPFDPDHVEDLDGEQSSDFLSGIARSAKELFTGKAGAD